MAGGHPPPGPDQKNLIGSLFVNPGGSGLSGVDEVRVAGSELVADSGGRFNVVGWDPRGTNRSDPVRCFTSQRSQARFWRGVRFPVTPAQSRAYARKVTGLARRCGRVSGPLLDNISTTDTARDLNYLRQLVRDPTLTYLGFPYGSFLGETYANMFPGRVRAMLLNGVIDPRPYVKRMEARTAYEGSSAGAVLAQFVKLCQAAGPARCALARHAPQTVAQRVAALFRRARRAPIPAPHARPPGVLSYSDLLLTTFAPLGDPDTWQARVLAGYEVRVERPKSRHGHRTLPLDEALAGALRTLKARQAAERLAAGEAYEGSGYVAADELGHPVHPEWYTDEFHRVSDRAGVRRIWLHESRHTACSLMEKAGVPVSVISAWAGHHSAEFTMRQYVHASQGDLAAGRDALSAIYRAEESR